MDMRDKSLGGCALGCALALLSWVIILGAGSGDGYGDGDGSGYGYGDGSGYGDGDGW